MYFYHEIFPERAEQEILALEIQNGDLPKGYYYFLESYCTNPECYCEEAVVQLERKPTEEEMAILPKIKKPRPPTAVLTYSWRKPLSQDNPSSFSGAPKTPWTHSAQRFFKEHLEKNPEYRAGLQEHYDAIRKEVQQNMPGPQMPLSKSVTIKRNEPCPCGSGNKFKKCCLLYKKAEAKS